MRPADVRPAGARLAGVRVGGVRVGGVLLAGVLVASVPLAGAAQGRPEASVPGRPAVAAAGAREARLDAVDRQLAAVELAVSFVETQYSRRVDPDEAQTRNQRFSDGQVQHLLGNHAAAAVLFTDLVGDPAFRTDPRHGEALFYLADSLAQQGDLTGARVHLRALLERGGPRFHEALARYLETASRLDPLEDVDRHVERARELSADGSLPPEVAYGWGKALLRRRSLPLAERLARARAVLTPLAAGPAGPVKLPAAYLLGVCHVEAGELEEAVRQFRDVAALPVRTPRDARVREMAHLSLGRVLYELDRQAEAVGHYQQVGRDSPVYAEALYETAWAQVRQGAPDAARRTTGLLLTLAPDSPLAPGARLLQGHLLLKLGQHDAAAEAYAGVINTCAPVRDELEALLAVNQDPAAYFDSLLARGAGGPDVAQLLPEMARRYTAARDEVADGLRLAGDLEGTRQALAEARALAARLEGVLSGQSDEAFPDLQEAAQRTDVAETALVGTERDAVVLVGEAARELLSAGERAGWERLLRARAALEVRLAELPASTEELEARRVRRQARVDALDREAGRLSALLQSMAAEVAAVERWAVDTEEERQAPPLEEKAFLARVRAEAETLAQLEAELGRVRGELTEARARASTIAQEERRGRDELVELLASEHALLARAGARGGPEVQAAVARAERQRERGAALRRRLAEARRSLQEKTGERSRRLRAQVASEVALLEAYAKEAEGLAGGTRQLVGEVAFGAFRQVSAEFDALVLRADLGLVDVAFTRKTDVTETIQRVAEQKEQDLERLRREFEDVLAEEDGE